MPNAHTRLREHLDRKVEEDNTPPTIETLTASAHRGDPRACNALAYYCQYGHPDLKIDVKQAVAWYRKALRLGCGYAAAQLIEMNEMGKSGPRDFVQMCRDATAGILDLDDSSRNRLDDAIGGAIFRMTPEDAEAMRACDDPDAHYGYAHALDGQVMGERKTVEICESYTRALNASDPTIRSLALLALGLRIKWTQPSEIDALEESGNATAHYGLARAFDAGEEIERDPDMARTFYAYAAERGHADAAYRLACLYRAGDGTNGVIDLDEAFRLLTMARGRGSKEAAQALAEVERERDRTDDHDDAGTIH